MRTSINPLIDVEFARGPVKRFRVGACAVMVVAIITAALLAAFGIIDGTAAATLIRRVLVW